MRTFAIFAALAAACLSVAQTTVSASASDDAIAPSIAVFTSTEMTPRTIIRIAYVDGCVGGMFGLDPGTNVYVKDYTSAMSLIGERTITISGTNPRYTQPRLSRDGRGVVFFGSKPLTEPNPTIPFYAALTSTPYSGTGSVSATVAPYGGATSAGNLGDSSMLFLSARTRPPAISNLTGGKFLIFWQDLLSEPIRPPFFFGYTPIMCWDTGASVTDISGTNGWMQPAINDNGEYLVYVQGNQVYRSYSTTLAFGSGAITTISQYASTNGNAASSEPNVDASGANIVFQSDATNLRASDTNWMRDVYVWSSGTLSLAYNDPGMFASSYAGLPSISPDGNWIGFESTNEDFHSYTSSGQTVRAYRVERGSPGTLTLMSRDAGNPINAKGGACADVANNGHFVFETGDSGIASGDTRTGCDIIYRDN